MKCVASLSLLWLLDRLIDMSKSSALILLGVLVVLAPFSGLPDTFRTVLLVLFGLCVFGIGLFVRAHEQSARAQVLPPSVSAEPEPVHEEVLESTPVSPHVPHGPSPI